MPQWNYVAVQCGCGKQSSIRIDQFNRKGGTWICRSCAYKGRPNKFKGTGIRHNPDLARTYSSYCRAKRRCKVNHKGAYSHVEFRFESFEQWLSVLGIRPEGMSVDRIDPMGHYEPGNVRWATVLEQARNRNPRYTWKPKPSD